MFIHVEERSIGLAMQAHVLLWLAAIRAVVTEDISAAMEMRPAHELRLEILIDGVDVHDGKVIQKLAFERAGEAVDRDHFDLPGAVLTSGACAGDVGLRRVDQILIAVTVRESGKLHDPAC